MEPITVDDVRGAAKLLKISFTDIQVKEVASALTSSIFTLQPLTQETLPKEIEPATYGRTLSKSET